MRVVDVRSEFKRLYQEGNIVSGRGGATVEIVGASFLADEETIFGKLRQDYVERERQWYASQVRNINMFPGGAPNLWLSCAGYDGSVNSNYGWCLDSEENGSQRRHVIEELRRNPESRRAEAIYTRPSMHVDAVEGGKQDFICTNAVVYLLRRGALDAIVQMRSSDAVFGYRNDRAWQLQILQELATTLHVDTGTIYWQAASLHVYESHFGYLE